MFLRKSEPYSRDIWLPLNMSLSEMTEKLHRWQEIPFFSSSGLFERRAKRVVGTGEGMIVKQLLTTPISNQLIIKKSLLLPESYIEDDKISCRWAVCGDVWR